MTNAVVPTGKDLRAVPQMPGGQVLLGHLPRFRKDVTGWFFDIAKSKMDLVATPLGFFRNIAVATSPAIANEVLVTKQYSFEKSPGMTIFLRPVLGDGLLTSARSTHERFRRLLAPVFAPKRMVSYAATMTERAQNYAARLQNDESLDLSASMMAITLDVVCKTLFDAEIATDAGAVGAALTTALEVATRQLSSVFPLPPQVPSPGNLRYRRAVEQLDAIVYRIIRSRRGGTDRGDVLSIMLEARDEHGTMTDGQIRDETMTMFLAGHETTANALAWAFYLLARHPEVRAVMEAELDALEDAPTLADLKRLPYTLAVFKETMRLYPPVYSLARQAIEDVVIDDYLIKKNTIVFVNVIGIHRRVDLWEDAERFNPERFLNDKEKQLPRGTYLPFGAGARVCIGNHFALMEGHLLLATLGRRARFEFVDPRPIALDPLLSLRPKGGMPVRVKLRS